MWTVRWPVLARLEVSLSLLAFLIVVQRSPSLGDLSMAAGARFGIDASGLAWSAAVLLLLAPALGVTVGVDRLLRARHGFVLLSAIAIAVWAAIGFLLADQIADSLPAGLLDAIAPNPATHAALIATAVGMAAAVLHAKPIRIGLRDRGFIGLRLAALSSGSFDDSGAAPNPRGRKFRMLSRGGGYRFAVMLGGGIVVAVVLAHFMRALTTPAGVADAAAYAPAVPRVVTPVSGSFSSR